MANRPVIENAPGLTWRPCKEGWEARWRPRADLVARGYPPTPRRLWAGTEPTDAERAHISDQCRDYQADMLVFGRGGFPLVATFDGTLRSLIGCYQADPDSTYQRVRFRTREHYRSLMLRIDADYGDDLLGSIKARDLLRWHENWTKRGVAMAHSVMGMLRTLVNFGAIYLEDPECERLSGVLAKMRFKVAKPRETRLTAEQANAVRAMAHKMGRPSIALAQAFQFEVMLRQKDVIGEWVPRSEPGMSDVTHLGDKWLWGIRWSEIDQNLILRHTTSKRGKNIEVNLRLAPMVMEEINLLFNQAKEIGTKTGSEEITLPASGPIIVCEFSGRPWTTHEFRRWWRKVADACSIPKNIKNMDSRAGAISEATDAGAELEHVRHAATHGDIAMTQRYSRGNVEKVAQVMKRRAEYRNKPR
jgi:hypothetical protein